MFLLLVSETCCLRFSLYNALIFTLTIITLQGPSVICSLFFIVLPSPYNSLIPHSLLFVLLLSLIVSIICSLYCPSLPYYLFSYPSKSLLFVHFNLPPSPYYVPIIFYLSLLVSIICSLYCSSLSLLFVFLSLLVNIICSFSFLSLLVPIICAVFVSPSPYYVPIICSLTVPIISLISHTLFVLLSLPVFIICFLYCPS
ncbi:unnamed protein product [Acanthosepion pharaonis]|uniref:Uncharacterized protein n=1 Tax=Acanthosepion pharaonis TaxID=158019 RepID=A0A812EL61_ACAPH|nr:unnamed protein product [Sepia pharaonis]